MNFRLISVGVGLASVVGFACANGTDNVFPRGNGSGGSSAGGGFGVGGSPPIGNMGGTISGGGPPIGTDNPKGDPCVANKNCTDFPANPIFDDGVAPGDVAGFGSPGNLAAPAFCLMEPQLSAGNTPGAMFPANWLRPRFRWDGAPAGAVFEIRLHTDTETSDLVAYTKQSTWLVPFNIWQKMGANVRTVQTTVRALAGGQVTGIQGNFEIAPVVAGGNMVYWGTISSLVSPTSSFLVGFSVGNEVVVKALTLEQVNGAMGPASFGQILNENGKDLRGQYDPTTATKGFLPGQVQCIGCHIQLPDKVGVLFTDDWAWNKVVAVTDPNPAQGGVGTAPTYVTAGARAILKQPGLGTSTAANKDLAPDLWNDAHKVIVTSYYQDVAGTVPQRLPFGPAIDQNQGKPPAEKLIWIDLATTAPIRPEYGGVTGGMDAALQTARNSGIIASKTTAWDYITVSGEMMPANILPNITQDGSRIVYTAATGSQNGGLDKTKWVEADLHVVPFNAGHGGVVTPIQGASDQGVMEYYPAWAPDAKLIAFTRVEDRTSAGYYNQFGEINVVDEAGTRTRLVANDPPACSGEHSPGVINSWPKWAPNVKTADGKDYYFVIFSSARKYPNPIDLGVNINNPGILQKPSQLYIAAVVRDPATNTVTTYPAIYLWNQGYTQQGSGATATAIPFQSNNLTPAWDEFVIRTVDVPPGTIPR
jgi:hypothetical protein